ncbi:MAG: GGDEF domain-containing protein [Lachnospiraceae bacterium]|nr:GGDEF domain-containing protein [Lachnospiraceae bacterium]
MKQMLVQYKYYETMADQMSAVVKEYESGLYKHLLFHIYSGILEEKLLSDITGAIAELFPEADIAGTVSAGEIAYARLMEKGVLISAMLFEKTEIRKFVFSDIKGNEVSVGEKIRTGTEGVDHIKAVELLLPGTEFNTRIILEEMSKMNPGIQVFGGYAGGHSMKSGEHFIFDENGLTDNKIFAITYAGEDFHIDVDKSVGWRTLGHHFVVTKADENRLIEIDNAPAVEVYEKYLSINKTETFAEETFEFPLIVKVENDELLRHTLKVEDDGTLDLAGYVTEGMYIYLSYGDPTFIVQKVNKRLDAVRKFKPEAILLYSCSVRKEFWEAYVNMEMIPFGKMAATSGFHTWGEVKRNPETNAILEYNITLLSIAMREGDAPEGELQEVAIDDSVLEGQASLIKRLTQLVSATTSELQVAYRNLAEMNERLTILSNYDALTGLNNRRHFEELTGKIIEKAIAEKSPTSFIMTDIDYFKSINDTFGHLTGDEVLKEFAEALKSSIESIPGAEVGRWGGEEFLAVLPGLNEKEALEYAEKLREEMAGKTIPSIRKSVTISIGIITTDGEEDRTDLFNKVDHCLYEAKNNGRNCCVQYKTQK